MGWGASLAAGAGSLFGSLLQNSANRREAERARGFTERMSNTAHQREVADLRAAGLNPILSATGGSGASTPQASQAQMENALAPAVTSAVEARRLKKEIAGVDSQIGLNEMTGKAAGAAALKDLSTAKNVDLNTQLLKFQMPALKKDADWNNKANDWDNIMKRAEQFMSIIPSAKGISRPVPVKKPTGSHGPSDKIYPSVPIRKPTGGR